VRSLIGFITFYVFFAEAEVAQLDVTVEPEQDIFGLEVAVDYLVFVQTFQSDHYFA